ncbi:hypothetical protein [Marinobacter sp.]|uniref:hypothetical protein n=1 Tax=Marinobacter sp. TaxID=50741 RepID=UPI003A930E0A
MRKPLVSNVPIPGSQGAKSVAYQAWIMEYQYQAVTEAWGSSNIGWPEWTANALSRLYDAEKETPGTIKLLLSSWPRGRKGKKRLSFRLSPETLSHYQKLATDNNGTIQGLLAHGLYIEAMASGTGRS